MRETGRGSAFALCCALVVPMLAPSTTACGKGSGGSGGNGGSSGSSGAAGGGGLAGGGGSAGAAPCAFSSPQDLGLDPNGDDSLDIKCVSTGVATSGRPWVRVTYWGAWLPSTNFYSWFSTVTLTGEGGELGAFTRERHAGADATLGQGAVVAAATAFTPESNGFLVVFEPTLAPQIYSAKVRSGVLLSQGGTLASDEVVVTPFDATVADP